MAGPRVLPTFLIVTLAAFGGIYAWALPAIVAGALLLLALAMRRVKGGGASQETRALDRVILVVLGALAFQLVPLPMVIRGVLSPRLAGVEALLLPVAAPNDRAFAPLSLDPVGTVEAGALVLAAALTFWAARRLLSLGGIRSLCRAIAAAGVVFGVAAIVQRAVTPRLIYGFWEPAEAGALPFGPVVNRNHFAGWLLMASALTTGYVFARLGTRGLFGQQRLGVRRTLVTLGQSGIAWTASASAIAAVAVVSAQSRSALVGLLMALATVFRSRARSWRAVFTGAGVLAAVAVFLLLTGQPAATRLAERFATPLDGSGITRLTIWRESVPVARDFWLTGVGAGAYGRAMLIYQRTHAYAAHLGAEMHFNHAHNHYLQVITEGGVLVSVPALVAIVLLVRLMAIRLVRDRSEMRFVRVGAAGGLLGIAVQSIWEVPLTMPAAALLAASLAAVATHERQGSAPASDRQAPLADATDRPHHVAN